MVASIEELEKTWKDLYEFSHTIDDSYETSIGNKRNLQIGSGWLPKIKGYVPLAACEPSESAYEYNFEGNETYGALTYWMLKAFSQLEEKSTFKQLHQFIVSNFNNQFPLQTPTLEGDLNRKLPFHLKKN